MAPPSGKVPKVPKIGRQANFSRDYKALIALLPQHFDKSNHEAVLRSAALWIETFINALHSSQIRSAPYPNSTHTAAFQLLGLPALKAAVPIPPTSTQAVQTAEMPTASTSVGLQTDVSTDHVDLSAELQKFLEEILGSTVPPSDTETCPPVASDPPCTPPTLTELLADPSITATPTWTPAYQDELQELVTVALQQVNEEPPTASSSTVSAPPSPFFLPPSSDDPQEPSTQIPWGPILQTALLGHQYPAPTIPPPVTGISNQ